VSAVYDEIDQKVPIAAKYVEYAVKNQDDDAIELDPANEFWRLEEPDLRDRRGGHGP
jgi:hypothetical protein